MRIEQPVEKNHRFIPLVLFALVVSSSAEASEYCVHILSTLTGDKPLSDGRVIRDRSAHVRINDHEAAVLFLQTEMASLGYEVRSTGFWQPADYGPLRRIRLKPQTGSQADLEYTFSLSGDNGGSVIERKLTNIEARHVDEDSQRPLILVGAHFDVADLDTHNGMLQTATPRTRSYFPVPGAEDNASGVAVVADLARRFANQSLRKADIRFIFFDGEESGLFGPLSGSKHYVANLGEEDRERVSMVIILDRVGSSSSPSHVELRAGSGFALEAFGSPRNEMVWDVQRIVGAEEMCSDHIPFIQARIPAALVTSSTARPPHFHSPSDDMSVISFPHMMGITRDLRRILNEAVVR